MGDIIRVEKIMLLYGHLYQIDYYNETRGQDKLPWEHNQ